LKNSILKVVAYFDLFNYPVNHEEIRNLMDRIVERDELSDALNQLVHAECLYQFGEFYTLRNDPSSVKLRLEGNERAKPLIFKANRISRFIAKFPFVRGVGVSGSLSKNFASQNADIDWFIITKANRLWISRTLLHLYKKLSYLTGSQHWFCMNYFIDEEALQIQEKNIFTAIELITLKPFFGTPSMARLFAANQWAQLFISSFKNKFIDSRMEEQAPRGLKKILESLFNNKLGDRLDDYLNRLTARRWLIKEEKHKLNMKGNRMGLRTGKHFSKPNPVFFQENLLGRYFRNMDEWERKWAAKGIHERSPFFLKEII
jgi:hypothetical protein